MVNHELTGRNFLGKHFNVVAALKGILTVSTHVRVACVGFEVVFREPMVFKPVKGFAGVLCESVDGFFEAHVFAVGMMSSAKAFQLSLILGSAFCMREP